MQPSGLCYYCELRQSRPGFFKPAFRRRAAAGQRDLWNVVPSGNLNLAESMGTKCKFKLFNLVRMVPSRCVYFSGPRWPSILNVPLVQTLPVPAPAARDAGSSCPAVPQERFACLTAVRAVHQDVSCPTNCAPGFERMRAS